jgi:hypothetical protein
LQLTADAKYEPNMAGLTKIERPKKEEKIAA